MYDCFISGAGPVGLFFAYQLAKAGHSVYICDAKKSPAQYQSRALGMTARTIEVLENRGVASHFLKEASVIRGVEVFIYGSKAGTISVSALDNPYPHLTGLPQDRTETILGDLLGALGTPIHWETSCVDYSQSDDGVEVRIKRHQEGEGDQQEEVIRAKYIVGADGTHSQVRRVTDSWTYEGYAVATRFALADVVLKGEDAEKYLSNTLYGKMFYQEKGVFGLFPLKVYEDGSVRVRAFGNLGSYELDKTERNSSTHGIESELSLEDLQKVIDERLAPLKVTVTDPTWISNFRINERKANGFRRGRAFVMGDAAHCHSPAGGQGMNLGLQDADNLAWKLSLVLKGKASDPEKLLDSYNIEREPVVEATMKVTGSATAAGITDSWFYSIVRVTAIRAALWFDTFSSKVIEGILQNQVTVNSSLIFPRPRNATKLVEPGTMIKESNPLVRRCVGDDAVQRLTLRNILFNHTALNKHVAMLVTSRYSSQPLFPFTEYFYKAPLPKETCGRVVIEPSCGVNGYRLPFYAKEDKEAENVFWIEDHVRLAQDQFTLSKRVGLTEYLYEANPPAVLVLIRPDLYIAHSCLVRSEADIDEALDLLRAYLQ